MTKMSLLPFRSLVKATRRPFGDQAGLRSFAAGSFEMSCAAPPSAFIT
jgi:hypothetical protein